MRRGVAEAQHVAAEGFLCDGEEQGDPLFIGQCRLSHMECKVQQYRFLKRRNRMHPMDAWIQFAQYLNLTELVVLAEALIRRYGYAIEQFTQRLTAFHRVIGRARCEAALKLVKPSDSVQETRTRLALAFGLPIPQTQYGITDSENGYTYTVDMKHHNTKSLLNMMAIITVASANNMCGTSKNVDVCGNWAGPSSRCSPMTCGTPPNNVPSHKRLPPRCKYRFLAVLNLHAGY